MVVNKNTTLQKKKYTGDIIFITYRNQRITCDEKPK